MTLTIEILYTVLLALATALGISATSQPLTDHAENSHIGEAVNAASIVSTVEAELKGDPRNPCEQSVLMLCTHHNGCADLRAVFVCYHGPYGDGLIIGLGGGSEARVVTAFRARRAYWNKVMVRDRCLPINMDFLGAWMRIWYPGLFQ